VYQNGETQAEVALILYEKRYQEMLINYCLAEEQRKYTALPVDALKKCEEEDDRHPILIMFREAPAGFFVLHGREGARNYSDNPGAILLRSYSIATDFQGKGIASASLKLLPSFVKQHFQGKNEIILGVNVDNLKARSLYHKNGFIDTGRRQMGRKGELIILQFNLNCHITQSASI
jgi:RimJ/RimL family protein N-acetyltransferase